MNAVQAFWTKPSGFDNNEKYIYLTMMLSALKWREKNGSIKLVTDTVGKKLIENLGGEYVWDEISTSLDEISNNINPNVFWAAGKLFAIKDEQAPFFSIDTDFIVWDKISVPDEKLCVIHREELNKDVYPNDFTYFDDGYSWTVKPCNTAFYYINSKEFQKEYCTRAIEFMQNCSMTDTLKPMVFAEQRLFSMIAEKMKINIFSFSDISSLNSEKNKTFTHLWGYKSQIRNNADTKSQLTLKLIERIKNDFPNEWKKIIL